MLNGIFYGFYRMHVEGAEHIPDTGAVIVAPNHKSSFDPPIVGVAIKNRLVHYMAKAELFKNPVFGWVLRKMGAFPVKRGTVDRMAIKQAVRELKNGHVLGIFPEGTRIKKRRFRSFPFRNGIFSFDDRCAYCTGGCAWNAYFT